MHQVSLYGCPKAHDSVPTTSRTPHATRKRVPVENCRKVSGTLRSTSTTVVINTIKQTTPSSLGPSFSIKWKFKNSQNGTTRKWWFVIRGNKPDIDLLDKEWPNVALQTGWKLEPVLCFESAESTPAQLPSSNTVLSCDEPPTPTPLQPQLPNTNLSLPPPPTLLLLQSVKILLELALPLQTPHLITDYLQSTWRVKTLMAFQFLGW